MELDLGSLKESNDFLNDLYENVTSAIFLVDTEARIHHFNDSFKTLFYKPEDQVLGQACGEALGCAFQADESKPCGETSNCEFCPLRKDIITSFTRKVPVYKDNLEREFVICGRRMVKHFQFTTKYSVYNGLEYVLVIVDDVTDFVNTCEKLESLNQELAQRNQGLQELLKAETSRLMESVRSIEVLDREKEALIQEVRHRVGNNLQVISSLLNLAKAQGKAEEAEFIALRNRIRAVVEVYRHAEYEEGMAKVRTQGFLASLVDALVSPRGIRLSPENLRVDLPSLAIEVALPLGLVIGELLTLPSLKAPLRLTLVGDGRRGHLELSPGGDPEGLSFASLLVEQLGGAFRPRATADQELGFDFRL